MFGVSGGGEDDLLAVVHAPKNNLDFGADELQSSKAATGVEISAVPSILPHRDRFMGQC
ncbi:hypothetical protein D9757_008961 [Collybiopsis confluens]|uniref:Uncharacterized protein n=1 Tax=Collybiopsis confluens TaxID=2823264 RepID=A0A8H5M673_9AGAR|nr:hypothetical protein D9757_008961 [Collybiopsis confluens]